MSTKYVSINVDTGVYVYIYKVYTCIVYIENARKGEEISLLKI
jgi:hypothetical protein